MNTQEFVDGLKRLKGSTLVSLVAETIPKMRKSGNPFWGQVTKVSKVNGLVNWIYENAVNAQRAREGLEVDFAALPRKWGRRIVGTPLVEHNGALYLEVKVQSASPEFFHAGGPIDAATLAPYLQDVDNVGRQEVARPVILRDYAIQSIRRFTFNGETFTIT